MEEETLKLYDAADHRTTEKRGQGKFTDEKQGREKLVGGGGGKAKKNGNLSKKQKAQ